MDEMMKKLRTQMRWIMIVIAVAFLLSTFLMYERRGGRGPRRDADGNMVDYEVAEIDGRPLMRSQIDARVRAWLDDYGRGGMASFDLAEAYQAVLDSIVLEQQMAREVASRGIVVSDAEADREMKAQIDMTYPTRETFYQALAQSGVKLDDYRRSLARQMANERLLREAIGDVEVSEDQAVQFYDTMKGLFYRRPAGAMVHLADLATSDDAELLRARLAGGQSWEEATSSDVLPAQGVVNVTHEPIFLSDASMSSGPLSPLGSLDVGAPSAVLSITSGDFAVALKTEILSESIRPYDDVSADIRVLLRQQEERQRLAEYEQTLMAQAQVTIHDPSLFPQPRPSDPVAPPTDAPLSADVPASLDAEPALSTDVQEASGDMSE